METLNNNTNPEHHLTISHLGIQYDFPVLIDGRYKVTQNMIGTGSSCAVL